MEESRSETLNSRNRRITWQAVSRKCQAFSTLHSTGWSFRKTENALLFYRFLISSFLVYFNFVTPNTVFYSASLRRSLIRHTIIIFFKAIICHVDCLTGKTPNNYHTDQKTEAKIKLKNTEAKTTVTLPRKWEVQIQ